MNKINSKGRNKESQGTFPLVEWAFLFSLFCYAVFVDGSLALGEVRRASGATENAITSARTVLKSFLECEEAQEYKRCYAYFSSKYKDSWRKELGVTNANEYEARRACKQLTWHNPNIYDAKSYEGGKLVMFLVEMTYRQIIVGERIATDRINATFEMVREKGKWVIDAWKYG